MAKFYNNDERYGWCGPFEAESRDELVDGMMPTFREWAEDAWNGDDETTDSHDDYVAAEIETMRDEFYAALDEVK